MKVTQDTSGSLVLPGAGAAIPGGVVPWHWGTAIRWAGPGGASAVGAAAGTVLVGADGTRLGVGGWRGGQA